MESIGIYGGTFNPPHVGHIRAAAQAIETLGLDKLLLIPDRIAPHKALPGNSPDPVQRLEMLRLGADHPKMEVCDLELRREGPSYTFETVAQLRQLYPQARLYLLVGTDMFLTLEKWFRAEDIFRLADIVLMRRETDAGLTGLLSETAEQYRARFGARIHEIDEPPLEVSSTELRERLRAGLPTDGLLPGVVADYIEKNKLYRSDEE